MIATGSIYLIADLVREHPARARLDACESTDRRPQLPGAMIGFVAVVVATVILVFFGVGYLLGRILL